MNVNKLKGKIVECGFTGKSFEAAIGMSHTAFYKKMNSMTQFTLDELQTIINVLSLGDSDIIDIFFSRKVA